LVVVGGKSMKVVSPTFLLLKTNEFIKKKEVK